MSELFDFINKDDSEQFDLLKTSLAHHRFAWIHPFANGNGRTVRMLTYAMLVKQGFNVNQYRILNPTAIFCNDRNLYYDKLALADKGTDKALLKWCEYVISGLSVEINKIDRLLDYNYLGKEIILPAVKFVEQRKEVTPFEFKITKLIADKQIIKSSNIESMFSGKTPAARSQALKRMVERKIIKKAHKKRGYYLLELTKGPLLRGVVNSLKDKGFVPESIE